MSEIAIETWPKFKRKLKIQNMDHFREAMKFSNKNIKPGNHSTLKENLKYLLDGNFYNAETLYLMTDFVKHSFMFQLLKDTPEGPPRSILMGGIILHGLGETFSVELTAPAGIHYSIHT